MLLYCVSKAMSTSASEHWTGVRVTVPEGGSEGREKGRGKTIYNVADMRL